MTAWEEGLLADIADGYVPGPDQFRSIVRSLVGMGFLTRSGSMVLDMGAGPEIRVPTYSVTLEGHAALDRLGLAKVA